jgi:hypothetical protein
MRRSPSAVPALLGVIVLMPCLVVSRSFLSGQVAFASIGSRGRTLVVQINGVPTGARPDGFLSGPGVHRLVRSVHLVLHGARSGRYTLRLRAFTLERRSGAARVGAMVLPARGGQAITRLKRRESARLLGVYDTVVNPVVRVRSKVVRASGLPSDPSKVALAQRVRLNPGQVLVLPQSQALPHGLLGRVVGSHFSGATTVVSVQPVSIFSVLPVARFDIPLSVPGTASAHTAIAAECGKSIGPAFGIYRTISNPRLSGGWNTISVLGKQIPIGAQVAFDGDIEAGINDLQGAEIGASCELDIPFNGTVLGVPVTGQFFGDIHASIGGGVGLQASVGAHITAKAATVGAPPVMFWSPTVSLTSPSLRLTATAEVSATLGIGAGVKFGLGNSYVADATLNFNNDLDFEAKASYPDGIGCSLSAKFASFNAEGKVGGWTVESPATPPLYTRTLKTWPNCEPRKSNPGPTPGGGGATGWSSPVSLTSAPLEAVSCATASFCVAVDDAGHAFQFNGSVWTGPRDIAGSSFLSSVSCPSTAFCVVIGADSAISFVNGSWTAPVSAFSGLDHGGGVSCVSTSFCLAVAAAGHAATFNGSAWSQAGQIDNGFGGGISCVSTTFCLASDTVGNVQTFDGTKFGQPVPVDSGADGGVDSISCASRTFCAGVDFNGGAVLFNGGSWGPRQALMSSGFTSVSCAAGPGCTAVGITGFRFLGGSWSADTGFLSQSLPKVSCPTQQFCMAVNQAGQAISYSG